MGDYNNASYSLDKKGGLLITFTQLHAFKNCLMQSRLIESMGYEIDREHGLRLYMEKEEYVKQY